MKTLRTPLFATLAALSFVTLNASATAPAEFMKKVPISLSASAQTALGSETLTGFPVLVRLSTAISGFSYEDISSDGSDIAFGTDDGNTITPYPFEIDTWNPSGTSLVWVRVPSLAAASSFNLYYGNGASVANTSSDVWSDYALVWHLNETENGGIAADSGSYNMDGTNNTTVVADPNGKIGGARRISNGGQKDTDGGIYSRNYNDLALGDTFVVEGWAWHKNQTLYYDHLFYRKEASSGGNGWCIEVNNGATKKFDVRGGNSTTKQPSLTINMNSEQWIHYAFAYSGTTCDVYENGVKVSSLTGLGKATDNGMAFCIGNRSSGLNGTTDISWKGSFDEVRLRGGTTTVAWMAANYATANDPAYLAYGAAESLDATATLFAGAPTVIGDNGVFTFSATLTDGQGDLYMVFTDLATGVATTNALASDVSTPGTYTGTPALTAGQTYDYAVLGISPAGTAVRNPGDTPVYAGELSVAKTADTSEATMADGVFTVSRGTSTAGDLVVTYTVGGTAVTNETYEALSGTVTIPAGQSSATIAVTPIYCPSVQEDVTVVATLAPGAYFIGASNSATLTIANSEANPYVRFVSTTGSDTNNGLVLQNAKATIAAAVADFNNLAEGEIGTVYVAAGEYVEANGFTLDHAVQVIGMTGAPADVVIKRSADSTRVATLNHADAVLQYVTLKGGTALLGSNAYIDANGGTIKDCAMTGGGNGTWNAYGGGVYALAGLTSRCVVTNMTTGGPNGVLYGKGSAVFENCLVADNPTGGGYGIRLDGNAVAVNCTVTKNTGNSGSGIDLVSSTAKAVNCAIFNNVAPDNPYGSVWGNRRASGFIHCAADKEIPDSTDCIVGEALFADAANRDWRPTPAFCVVDQGTDPSTYASFTTDLDGKARVCGDAIDIGCYELDTTVPDCSFRAAFEGVTIPATATFTAYSVGLGDSVSYTWDFGDGTSGAGAVVEHVYETPGNFLVTLTATSSAGTCSYVGPKVFQLSPAVIYVLNANPNAAEPYDTPEIAAPSMKTAVDYAVDGVTIYVLPGDDGIVHQSAQTVVEKGVRILGSTGNPKDVTLQNDKWGNDGCRIFVLNHPDAFVANLTMKEGSGRANNAHGGTLYIKANGGTVSNCVVNSGSSRHFSSDGAGVYMEAGLVTHTEITGVFEACPAYNGTPDNLGVVVHLNAAAARMENCLIHDITIQNREDTMSEGPVVGVANGTLRNCTIVPNFTMGEPGKKDWPSDKYTGGSAIWCSKNGSVVNCVAAGLVNTNNVLTSFSGTASRYVNCAGDGTEVATWGGTNCISGTSATFFTNYALGDYTLKATGPLVGAGLNYDDMEATDFANHPRLIGSVVDIGCYESGSIATVILFR